MASTVPHHSKWSLLTHHFLRAIRGVREPSPRDIVGSSLSRMNHHHVGHITGAVLTGHGNGSVYHTDLYTYYQECHQKWGRSTYNVMLNEYNNAVASDGKASNLQCHFQTRENFLNITGHNTKFALVYTHVCIHRIYEHVYDYTQD